VAASENLAPMIGGDADQWNFALLMRVFGRD
jgi:hypothetical protein